MEDSERVRYPRKGKTIGLPTQIKIIANEDYTIPKSEMLKYQKEARLLLA